MSCARLPVGPSVSARRFLIAVQRSAEAVLHSASRSLCKLTSTDPSTGTMALVRAVIPLVTRAVRPARLRRAVAPAVAAIRPFHSSTPPRGDAVPTKANDLRAREMVLIDGEQWVIRSFSHVMPGKGGAFVQLNLQHIRGDRKMTRRVRSTESVDKVELFYEGPYSVLYQEGEKVHLMHGKSFDQIELPSSLFGDDLVFVHEGMEIELAMFGGEPCLARLPNAAVLEVTAAQPVRDDTKNPSNGRPVTLSNGIVVKLPAFIQVGDRVKIRIEDRSYVEKVSS
jgi:elongation factor P